MQFFLMKMRTTWTDPMFQSVWSGPRPAIGQASSSFLLQNLYRGGKTYVALEVFMHSVLFLIYAGTGWQVIRILYGRKRTPHETELFSVVYFLGGMIYHLVSETKSQYVFMYVYLMIPMAIQGITDILRHIHREKAQ